MKHLEKAGIALTVVSVAGFFEFLFIWLLTTALPYCLEQKQNNGTLPTPTPGSVSCGTINAPKDCSTEPCHNVRNASVGIAFVGAITLFALYLIFRSKSSNVVTPLRNAKDVEAAAKPDERKGLLASGTGNGYQATNSANSHGADAAAVIYVEQIDDDKEPKRKRTATN
jgi:hypothetical protein